METEIREIDIEDAEECIAFAKRAARHFETNPNHYTYTDNKVVSGCLFAARDWLKPPGSVMVFKLDRDFPPVNYLGMVRAEAQT